MLSTFFYFFLVLLFFISVKITIILVLFYQNTDLQFFFSTTLPNFYCFSIKISPFFSCIYHKRYFCLFFYQNIGIFYCIFSLFYQNINFSIKINSCYQIFSIAVYCTTRRLLFPFYQNISFQLFFLPECRLVCIFSCKMPNSKNFSINISTCCLFYQNMRLLVFSYENYIFLPFVFYQNNKYQLFFGRVSCTFFIAYLLFVFQSKYPLALLLQFLEQI